MDHTTGSDTQPIMSNTLMEFKFRSKAGRKRKTKDGDKCLICGGRAIGINFGVQSCSPCKAFFRRNAVKLGTTEFQCRGDGNCPLTSDTRRQCNCCRLAKCFYVGMDRKAIRTEDQRQERRELIEFNRQKRVEQRNEDKKALIRPSGLLIYSQTYSLFLSSNDYTLLTNIFHAYERTCLSYTYKEHLSMPINETLTLRKFMNASSNIFIGLISYLKSIPEFNSIPIDTKISLIKSNIKQVFRKHSAYIIQHLTPDLVKDSSVFLHVFPKDLYMDMHTTAVALLPFVYDPILIRLFIVILMLSTYMNIYSEEYLIENNDENVTRKILAAQNIYVELLWRYIISRCSNYQQSVKLLSSLIARTLYSQTIQVKINQFIRTNISGQNQQLQPIIGSLWTP